MAMVKKLVPIGNSLGVLIDKPILEMLNITADTQLEVTTDGVNLMIKPLRTGHARRVQEATRAVIKAHGRTLRKLAE